MQSQNRPSGDKISYILCLLIFINSIVYLNFIFYTALKINKKMIKQVSLTNLIIWLLPVSLVELKSELKKNPSIKPCFFDDVESNSCVDYLSQLRNWNRITTLSKISTAQRLYNRLVDKHVSRADRFNASNLAVACLEIENYIPGEDECDSCSWKQCMSKINDVELCELYCPNPLVLSNNQTITNNSSIAFEQTTDKIIISTTTALHTSLLSWIVIGVSTGLIIILIISLAIVLFLYRNKLRKWCQGKLFILTNYNNYFCNFSMVTINRNYQKFKKYFINNKL